MMFYFARVKYSPAQFGALTVETCNVLSREVRVQYCRV